MPRVQESLHGCPEVSVLLWRQDNAWHEEQVHPTIFHVTKTDKSRRLLSADSDIAIVFANADQVRNCPLCRQCFTNAFQMPDLWWATYCRNSNGYFGCETTSDERENVTGLNAWSRFLVKQVNSKTEYEWYKVNIFTHWLSSPQQTVVLVFDAPAPLAARMPSPLLDNPGRDHLVDPFWIHTRLLEEVVRLQDTAVWSIRTQVRVVEEERRPQGKPSPDYLYLHNLARHAIHVSETLDLAVKTAGTILKQHTAFMEYTLATELGSRAASRNVHESLLWFEHMLESLRCRASSNKERLLNEIQLCFNSVAEYDAAISLQIGRATQSDSAAMKTIAFLTLTFLPATFISAIFSTSFFNYDAGSGGWNMSNKIWVYWAFAIPLTVVTAGLWYFWQRSLLNMLAGGDAPQSARRMGAPWPVGRESDRGV